MRAQLRLESPPEKGGGRVPPLAIAADVKNRVVVVHRREGERSGVRDVGVRV